MNDAMKERLEERTQIMSDVYNNKIPKRVPINVSLPLTVVADYAKIDRKAAYWDPSLLRVDVIEELCSLVFTDSFLYGSSVYTPVSSQTLASTNKIMSDTGCKQHPNTMSMEEDEYDELIADPYAFIIEKCIPRVYRNLDKDYNPGKYILSLAQEAHMVNLLADKEMPMYMDIVEKYAYPMDFQQGFGRAPMDWIGDQLRSFSGICTDVRRHRSKLVRSIRCHSSYDVQNWRVHRFRECK